jgi:hypothetical protein
MGDNRIVYVVVVMVVAKVAASILKLFDHLSDFILGFTQFLLKPS